jgi:hypothetical protein
MGFTLQSDQLALFDWGTPSLTLLRGAAFSWVPATPATLTITNLPTGKKYDLYLASFHPNEDGDRALFSTANATVTTSPQIVDTGGPAGNDSTWVEGANYARFANVQPDAAGNITVTMVGQDTTGSRRRAYLSGFQLVEIVPPTTTLRITSPDGLGHFTISGTTRGGLTVNLEKSTDLSLGAAGWSPAGTTTADGSTGAFSFPLTQGTDTKAFYRVK